ncbi:uncharacterized protein LOC133328954 [Musca vetustissima]|uniref:uncharacterized protein LOC133328954 n=1 Tax=Musca vetustissima TaxID=27455 RepID=UPI002AB7B553|nr:uncharacterized protein LOC133328954 [Musca vetustissima]
MNRELEKILIAYRRAVHPATGKSPAMLMLGRQMQTRLDLFLPNNDVNYNAPFKIIKHFNIGDRVSVRDYLSGVKWKFGVVEEKVGDLHYKVKLDDGRTWKRHVDQIRRNSVNLEVPNTERDDVMIAKHAKPGDNIDRSTNMGIPQSVIQTPTSNLVENPPTADADVSQPENQSESASTSVELRRSGRQRKIPSRYTD